MKDRGSTYHVVCDDDLEAVSREVRILIAEGWRPQGGIAVLHESWENERKGYTESSTTYYQAMARVPPP